MMLLITRIGRCLSATFARRAAAADVHALYQDIYLLTARDGLSFAETAVRLDLPISVVELGLAAALMTLARR